MLIHALEQASETTAGGNGALMSIVPLGFAILFAFANWKLFTKAGEPGWASIVPLYNLVVLFRISGKPLWWLLLLLIPGVNLVVTILFSIALAQRFGKTTGYGIGLAFLPMIFYPMLGFGSATYQGASY
jgi:uncharacterized protein DUF5684